jgi:hypothetical protein
MWLAFLVYVFGGILVCLTFQNRLTGDYYVRGAHLYRRESYQELMHDTKADPCQAPSPHPHIGAIVNGPNRLKL